jgi:hypothetical protein
MKITVEVSDETARNVARLMQIANDPTNVRPMGELNIQTLIEILLEDCAMVVRRPGCWEASNMAQVLTSHGYEV